MEGRFAVCLCRFGDGIATFSHRLRSLGKPFYIEKTNILAPPKEVATVCPASRFWALGATLFYCVGIFPEDLGYFLIDFPAYF